MRPSYGHLMLHNPLKEEGLAINKKSAYHLCGEVALISHRYRRLVPLIARAGRWLVCTISGRPTIRAYRPRREMAHCEMEWLMKLHIWLSGIIVYV